MRWSIKKFYSHIFTVKFSLRSRHDIFELERVDRWIFESFTTDITGLNRPNAKNASPMGHWKPPLKIALNSINYDTQSAWSNNSSNSPFNQTANVYDIRAVALAAKRVARLRESRGSRSRVSITFIFINRMSYKLVIAHSINRVRTLASAIASRDPYHRADARTRNTHKSGRP